MHSPRIRRLWPVTRYQANHGSVGPVNDSVDRLKNPVHARFVFDCDVTRSNSAGVWIPGCLGHQFRIARGSPSTLPVRYHAPPRSAIDRTVAVVGVASVGEQSVRQRTIMAAFALLTFGTADSLFRNQDR